MALTVTHVFMLTELLWSNIIYVTFQVARRYRQWSSIATAGAVTTFSRIMEGHIRVASNIQEHKTGPFYKRTDLTIKSVMDLCEYVPSTHTYNYNERHWVTWNIVWNCEIKLSNKYLNEILHNLICYI
jgi:hypothetical protein